MVRHFFFTTVILLYEALSLSPNIEGLHDFSFKLKVFSFIQDITQIYKIPPNTNLIVLHWFGKLKTCCKGSKMYKEHLVVFTMHYVV